jgi:glycine cleavage system transcriptional repressor
VNNQFVISIMSRDRVGIIYDVSSAISQMQGDIADLRQSVLRGYFTMILVASFPEDATEDTIRRRLDAINREGVPPLEITVRQVGDIGPAEDDAVLESAYVLTASGRDRIGFVATVSSFCAQNGINILDLSTAVDDGTYIMILLVDLSPCNVGEIRHELWRFGQETGFNVVLQHYDIFKATQEVSIV